MRFNTIITNTTKKGKVLEFEIDVGLRDDMRRFIREKIIHNLEGTKRFLELKEEKYGDICAGIYTYAVEKYGKILFLNSLSPSSPNNKIIIPYTDNHGFLDHYHKFDLVLKDKTLPDSCKVLREGGFTGSGFTSGFIRETPAGFEARKSIFYADFNKDDKYSSILEPPEYKRELLVKAVNEFLAFTGAKISLVVIVV
ncbi:MAG TPA: hypothetical protein VKA09_02225 [Nitrososphaeraceae archaeon]|nr:hypothetical protein [Nitrososphaeraceae archaeon]